MRMSLIYPKDKVRAHISATLKTSLLVHFQLGVVLRDCLNFFRWALKEKFEVTWRLFFQTFSETSKISQTLALTTLWLC